MSRSGPSSSATALALAAAVVLAVGVAPAAASTPADGNETTTTSGVGDGNETTMDDAGKTTDREHGSSNADLISWALVVLLALGAVTVVALLRD